MRIYLEENSIAFRTRDGFSIRSMTVENKEVSAWLISDFQIGDNYFEGEYTLILDRANLHEDYIYTTKIRQIAEGWNLKRGFEYTSRKHRKELEEAKTKKIRVPGGLTPFIPEGMRLIADFGVSGTSYFVVPKEA